MKNNQVEPLDLLALVKATQKEIKTLKSVIRPIIYAVSVLMLDSDEWD